MQTRKLKAQPTNVFFATVSEMFGNSPPPPASDNCRVPGNQTVVHSSDNEKVLGSSRKLGGAVKHLIDGSEKRICWLSFEFYSPRVIEKCSNLWSFQDIIVNISLKLVGV